MNEESRNPYLTKWKVRFAAFAASFGFQLAISAALLAFVAFGAILGGWMAIIFWSMVPVVLAALAFRSFLKKQIKQ